MHEEQFEVNLAEDRDRQGVWRVEVFDEDGAIFIAVFTGRDAKQIASEWATWKYGAVDEVEASKPMPIRTKPKLALIHSGRAEIGGRDGRD